MTMALDVTSEKAVCHRCGIAYGSYRAGFQVSYSAMYKGVGYLPICKKCVDELYQAYLAQCGDPRMAVRQMCRKLDLFWVDAVYDYISKKNSPRSLMTSYIQRINSVSYAGKSYDDTLLGEGTLWQLERPQPAAPPVAEVAEPSSPVSAYTMEDIPEEVSLFWGPGYTPDMYMELEQRRSYWMSRFPSDTELDIGTEAIIRQICSLELDINRDRAAGRSVDKSITALNTLLGSANLKPVQKKQEEADLALGSTPLGVWLYRYENKRPLPEIDEDLKDVNGLKRYVFTWMGHLCKMLGIKNGYEQLYEDEIAKLRVEKPEYDGDDDETFFGAMLSSENDILAQPEQDDGS